jgi:hypothetical protein
MKTALPGSVTVPPSCHDPDDSLARCGRPFKGSWLVPCGLPYGVSDCFRAAISATSVTGCVSDTQMLDQGVQACDDERYGLLFSCRALIMRAMPDSRAASSRV